MTQFSFDILSKDGDARSGVLQTSRGKIMTPAFMPVGTAGTVKGLYMDQVAQCRFGYNSGEYLSSNAQTWG